MNRMDTVFSQMAKDGKKILVSYFNIGDSYIADSVASAKRFFENGTTVLEIGLPYENPFLDGAAVSGSMERALQRTNLDRVLFEIVEIRRACPGQIIQLMTYFENIEKYGVKRFAEICSTCNIDAVLSPNANSEQMAQLDEELGKYEIYNLRFVPYHIDDATVTDLQDNAAGYVYLQAVDGKTGSNHVITDQIARNIHLLKKAGIQVPLIPGFGISSREHVRAYLEMGADGVVIGSAIINHIIAGNFDNYMCEIRKELDSADA